MKLQPSKQMSRNTDVMVSPPSFKVLFWAWATRAHIMQLRFMINSKKKKTTADQHLFTLAEFLLLTVQKAS